MAAVGGGSRGGESRGDDGGLRARNQARGAGSQARGAGSQARGAGSQAREARNQARGARNQARGAGSQARGVRQMRLHAERWGSVRTRCDPSAEL